MNIIDTLAGGFDGEATPATRAHGRRYLLEFGSATLLYVAGVFISAHTVEAMHGVARVADALLPVAGAVAMAIAFVRFVLRVDEFQRLTIVVSGGIAALLVFVFALALGFLENAGLPHLDIIYAGPGIVVIWGLTLPFVHRHFS